MDELQTLATLLAAPESPQAAERSLRRIQQRMRRPSRPSRRAWFAAGVSLAAAAAAAVVVVSGTAAPTAAPNGPPPTAAQLTAGGILLAAATTAEREPEGSGAYWHVKTSYSGNALESWTARDGRTWWRGDKTAGKVVKLARSTPFRLGGLEVSFEQLQKLPAEPDALKTWISDGLEHSDVKTSAGRLDAAGQARSVFSGLVSLVSQLPASPEVRAAAFRALASYPEVKNLGAVDGGEGLLIPFAESPVQLVVDPATSQVRNTNFYVTTDGTEVTVQDKPVTIDTGWTDTLPAGD
ncbi:CU044_5270 family protein [Nonomuraea sp. NPDC049028]|uniref:CU044_5270 family protein n=1 Tax=Nonomuraea sp. NPDC049028 TaxID=3364348 RepID=UPI00371D69CC